MSARCRICHRALKNPKWVQLGIGPVCASRQAIAEVLGGEQPVLLSAGALQDVGLICERQTDGRLATNIPQAFKWHSPTGFECGYGGSGPADLALNVLAALVPLGSDGARGLEDLGRPVGERDRGPAAPGFQGRVHRPDAEARGYRADRRDPRVARCEVRRGGRSGTVGRLCWRAARSGVMRFRWKQVGGEFFLQFLDPYSGAWREANLPPPPVGATVHWTPKRVRATPAKVPS